MWQCYCRERGELIENTITITELAKAMLNILVPESVRVFDDKTEKTCEALDRFVTSNKIDEYSVDIGDGGEVIVGFVLDDKTNLCFTF